MDRHKQPYNPEEMPDIPSLENKGWEALRQMLDEHMPQKEEVEKRVIPLYWRWMAAAVLFLVAGTLAYRFMAGNQSSDLSNPITKTSNIDKSHNTNAVATNLNTLTKDSSNMAMPTKASSHIGSNNDVPTNHNLASADFGKHNFSGKHTGSIVVNDFANKGTVPDSRIAENTTAGNNAIPVTASSVANTLNGQNTVASIASKNIPMGMENAPKKIKMDFSGLADSNRHQAIAKSNTNKENVEAASGFRQRMNQALWESEKSDSSQLAGIAKTQKIRNDSQLVAHRREQLEKYFDEKEEKEKAATNKPKVDLAVLVNRNMGADKGNQSGTSLYNLPVYPAVSASVKISSKVGFSTGVSTAAPGNFTNTSISGPVAMSSPAYNLYGNSIAQSSNDKAFLTSSSSTSKEVSFAGNSATEVQQAYYWQIPLMFDYYIAHSNLKLSAGTDFSIIQKVLVGNAYSSQLMNGNTYNNIGGVYQVRNFDPRLSVGAQYRINKMLIGARFSRSFQPALQYNGAPTNGGNNQVFNFSIGYSFMK